MKLQLNEETLNAYISEAMTQELEEGWLGKLFGKGASKGAKAIAKKSARKLGQSAGGDATRMARTKTPLKFGQNTRRAKNARLALRDFRKGRPVEAKVGNTTYFAKQEKGVTKFYSDAACKNEITDPKLLKSVKSSWNTELNHARNVLNSAQRNMAGTATVGALGAGWAIDHNKHKDDPWNAGSEPEDNNAPFGDNEGEGGFNDSFPWDETEPIWTPRQPKPTAPVTPRQDEPKPEEPKPTTPQPEEPKPQPVFPPLKRIEPVNANIPTGATTSQTPALAKHEVEPSIAQKAVQSMAQTTNQNTMGLRDRIKTNNQTAQQARKDINQAVRDGEMSRAQARDDKKLVRGANRTLRTGQPMSE